MQATTTRRSLGIASIAALLLTLVWVAIPTPARAADTSLCLEVTPEISAPADAIAGQVSLTARLVDCTTAGPPDAQATGGGVNIDFVVENPSIGGATYTTPDANCNTLPSAPPATPYPQCTVAIGDPLHNPGNSLVRAWINHDGNTATVEADFAEGRLSDANLDCTSELPSPPSTDRTSYNACTGSGDTVTPGDRAEPDDTDVVRISFKPTSQTVKEVTCTSVKAPKGVDASMPCRLVDQFDVPIVGMPIDAEQMSGANNPRGAGNAPSSKTTADYQDGGKTTAAPDGVFNVIVKGTRPEGGSDLGPAVVCAWADTDSATDGTGLPTSPDPSYQHNTPTTAGKPDGGYCQSEVDQTGAASVRAADATGLGTVTWEQRAPTTVTLSPQTESAFIGSTKTVTAAVADQFGDPYIAAGVPVGLEFFNNSPNDPKPGDTPSSPDRSCPTSTSGPDAATCKLDYTGNIAGTDYICGWINAAPTTTGATCGGEALSGTNNPAVDVVTKTWTVQQAATTTTTTTPPAEQASKDQGYYLVGGDGGVFAFGNAGYFGSTGDKKLNQPIIGIASKPGGTGYWLVAKDGGIFTFGGAGYFGSLGDKKLNAPILGMEPTITGNGYFLFGADGGIFTFGDAVFHGSTGDKKLNAPMIGMAVTAKGDGYWLVAQDGGVFTFNAPFYGSTGSMKLNQPVFDMAPMPNDTGYWLVARDGGIFTFPPNGPFYGAGTGAVAGTVIGMGTTPTGKGYWIADNVGKVVPEGDARHQGDRFVAKNNAPMVGFAVVPKAA
jgi:hypothetical protein